MTTEDIKYAVGCLLVIWVTGDTHTYIAEVKQEEPLQLKVTDDTGSPYHFLKAGDFIVRQNQTLQLQGDNESQQALLQSYVDKKNPLVSGLKRLGVTDWKLRTILPTPNV